MQSVLKLLFLVAALPALAFPPHVDFSDDMPTIIVHDELPDDEAAIVPESLMFGKSRGKNVLFVVADGDVGLKAKARHNLANLFGLTLAKTVAGNPGKSSEIAYVNDYLDDSHKAYLRVLAEQRGLRSWVPSEYRREIVDFVHRHGQVRIWFLANPRSIVDVLDQLPPEKINHSVSMGIWSDGLTKYNSYDAEAAKVFLEWTMKHKVPHFHVPSKLFGGLENVGEAIRDPRERLFASSARRGALKELRKELNVFGAYLADAMFRQYGASPWVSVWNHEREWFQDPITVEVAGDLQNTATWTPVVATVHPEQRTPLGYKVDEHPDENSVLFTATELNLPRLAARFRDHYRGAKILPDYQPEVAIDTKETTPIAVIGMPAIDVLGGMGALLGLGGRLKLAIADSASTPATAAIFRRYFDGYGRSDIEVAIGRGHTLEQMKTIEPFWLESLLVEKGGYAQAMFNADKQKALHAVDASALSGGEALVGILEKNPLVDVVCFATLEPLHYVVTHRPELLHRIGFLQIMGGVRGVPSGAVEWKGGDFTRNWEAFDAAGTAAVFDALGRYGINTVVYSSHVASGILNRMKFPQTAAKLDFLRTRVPVEREVAKMRVDWSEALRTKVAGLDVNDNYGPRLGWLMATIAALGPERAAEYFTLAPGVFTFDGKKANFRQDASSTVKLLVDIENDDNYSVLDQTMAYLRGRAADLRPWWTRVSGRVSCAWPILQ